MSLIREKRGSEWWLMKIIIGGIALFERGGGGDERQTMGQKGTNGQ